MDVELSPAQKVIIKRVALGHVEAYTNGRGLIGATRELVEDLQRLGLVATIMRSKNSFLYVLTDAGRARLKECFERPLLAQNIETRYCKHCGKPFSSTHHLQKYCGQCGDPKRLSRRHTREKLMADDEKHERIIASNTKWREWAKENDPMYRVRKAEAQARWRAKQKSC